MAKKQVSLNNLPDIVNRLAAECGRERSDDIFRSAEEMLKSLSRQVDDFGSSAVRKHFDTNMLPAIALYKSMQEHSLSPAEAKASVGRIMHSIVAEKAETSNGFTRLPFAYSLFRLAAPKVLAKGFPAAGWDMRMKQHDKECTAFNCHRCIYVDTTKALSCPELCELFCQNDDIKFGAFAPRIIFKRTQTLATGGTCCDFQLWNTRYLNN